ncbi:DUF4116 domain-containing protein [bacterium]|nr:DUF4116 domain-containing protein [bacterium]
MRHLQYAAEVLCADSEIVLNTVKQRYEALRFAAADFRADRVMCSRPWSIIGKRPSSQRRNSARAARSCSIS